MRMKKKEKKRVRVAPTETENGKKAKINDIKRKGMDSALSLSAWRDLYRWFLEFVLPLLYVDCLVSRTWLIPARYFLDS